MTQRDQDLKQVLKNQASELDEFLMEEHGRTSLVLARSLRAIIEYLLYNEE